jgi:hypothetical protein
MNIKNLIKDFEQQHDYKVVYLFDVSRGYTAY